MEIPDHLFILGYLAYTFFLTIGLMTIDSWTVLGKPFIIRHFTTMKSEVEVNGMQLLSRHINGY